MKMDVLLDGVVCNFAIFVFGLITVICEWRDFLEVW